MTKILAAVCFLIFLSSAGAKIYKRCELASELLHVHKIAVEEIAVWVCIAKYESVFNTSAVNRGSGDHGLFQISDLYWCSKEGQGGSCNAACASFEDDDIEDDVQCIRRIYNEHKRLSGNGFNAWVVYPLYCNRDVQTYIEDCFDLNPSKTTTISTIPTTEGEEEYEFPPLPIFTKLSSTTSIPKFKMKQTDIAWKTNTKQSAIKISSRPEVSKLSRRMPHKLNTEIPSVYLSSNLGYYDRNDHMTSRKNGSNSATFYSYTHENVNNVPHEIGNRFPKIYQQASTSKSIITTTFIPKTMKKHIIRNISVKPKLESYKLLQLNGLKYNEGVQTPRPLKIFTLNGREYGGRKQSMTYQRTQLDRRYIIERNVEGGFRLIME